MIRVSQPLAQLLSYLPYLKSRAFFIHYFFIFFYLQCQVLSLFFSVTLASRSKQAHSGGNYGNSMGHAMSTTASSASLTSAASKQSQATTAAKLTELKCCEMLTRLGLVLCRSGAFASLLEAMLLLVRRPALRARRYFDPSYFLWLIRYLTANFVLKAGAASGSGLDDAQLSMSATAAHQGSQSAFANVKK